MSGTSRSRGMRDILPAEMERFRRIESAFRDVCLGWGYQEVRTPTIEHLFLFTSAGTLSPQMLDRVYSFLDWDGWSGERVVLRPDSTIPTVRLFEENMPDAESAKLFYVQNVFRFEQGDESREDWQCGVELLGDTFPHGDIELILMATETIGRLGVDAQLRLSHPGIVRAILDQAGLTPSEQTEVYDRILGGDHAALDKLGSEQGRPMSALLGMEGEGPAYLDNLRATLVGDIPGITSPLDELRAISSVVAGLGAPHRIAPLGIRDFEYYTGPAFTLEAGTQRVGGGGRYDALAGQMGGRPSPASGFALEADGLAELLSEPRSLSHSITIRAASDASITDSFRVARMLRESGLPLNVAIGAGASAREVLVGKDGFRLSWNGSGVATFSDAGELTRAVANAMERDKK